MSGRRPGANTGPSDGGRHSQTRTAQVYSNAEEVLAHAPDVIGPYLDTLSEGFIPVAECNLEHSVEDLLEGSVCHSCFKRLNESGWTD